MDYNIFSTASLISRIHTKSAEFLQQRMKAQGLAELVSSHGFILFCLSKTDRMTMGELAKKINRDKSTTTVLVRKLTDEGFVSLEKSETDNRSKFIKLTDQGRKWNELTEQLSHELLDTYYKGFSETEKQEVCSFLARIDENLSESTCL